MSKDLPFDVDFNDAISAMMQGKMIQGSDFSSGIYVKLNEDGVATMYDANNMSKGMGNLILSKNLSLQSFRVISVSNQAKRA